MAVVDERTEKLLTVTEVAERLRVTRHTVRRWLREGTLKGKVLGDRAGWRIAEAEIERFLATDGDKAT